MHRGFSKHWYDNGSQFDLRWRGVPTVKCPLDLWMYQEIVHETRPELVVETGTAWGGSALYLAHLLDTLGHGRVVSIDVAPQQPLPEHPRIDFWQGCSSLDPGLLEMLRVEAFGQRTMVILDSDHARRHVLRELDLYAPLVSKGCYLIVEDSNRDGYRFGGGYPDGGPAEALAEWQPTNKGFDVDRSRERLGFTQNPDGYLRRVR